MIARMWKGWTKPENGDAYEKLLREHILPGIYRVDGYQGAYIMRQDEQDEVAFVIMTLFESIDSVKGFAGADYTTPVIEPEARALLSRFESTAFHYDVKMSPAETKSALH